MNRLSGEASPYLAQHADNPVDWYPWGEAAFAEARRRDVPIFLSIGYSTCHWCHVMADESFADPATAAVLNRDFVCVKVDREERPDVDRVYMTFVQATTGAGGWPLSVWLTPALEPFYGGTYFPAEAEWGRPSLVQVAGEIARAWRDDRDEVVASAGRLLARLRTAATATGAARLPDGAVLAAAAAEWARSFDERHGGFGDGAKFPRPSELLFLLREHARGGAEPPRTMALGTLRAMALGGLRDHVGGGFHRYAVDAAWRVPHFEKMLCDQAQLVLAMLEAWQVSGDAFFAQVAEDTLRYVARDLTSPEGGCYSAEDADSLPPGAAADAHPREGAFYVWTRDDLVAVLGPDAPAWERRFGVRPGGNVPVDPHGEFGAANLFYTARSIADVAADVGMAPAAVGEALARARQRLFEARARRPRPGRDEKVLTAWNGLMLAASARAARVLAVPGALGDGLPPTGARHLVAAQRCAAFVRATLWDAGAARLWRRRADGRSGVDGFAEDYACLAWGLLELFQADGDPAWLRWARQLHDVLDARFAADGGAGWYATDGTDPSVLLRQIDEYDGAEPAASSVAVMNLLTLARLTGETRDRQRAEAVLAGWGETLYRRARAVPFMLAAAAVAQLPGAEVALVGSTDPAALAPLRHVVDRRYVPAAVVLPVVPPHAGTLTREVAWVAPLAAAHGAPAAFLCRDFACERPTGDPLVLAGQLDALAGTTVAASPPEER
ncbi:MAG: thioredoxin domain-containing protein [Vicinamibacterales bacterium]